MIEWVRAQAERWIRWPCQVNCTDDGVFVVTAGKFGSEVARIPRDVVARRDVVECFYMMLRSGPEGISDEAQRVLMAVPGSLGWAWKLFRHGEERAIRTEIEKQINAKIGGGE